MAIKAIGKLNFIVHFWGGSGTGKTVAQFLAASVWADPGDGAGYVQTFNASLVGLEQLASFVNNLPLILDEFQLVKDKKSFEQTVYMLCEGIGKTRGAKTGGCRRRRHGRTVLLLPVNLRLRTRPLAAVL